MADNMDFTPELTLTPDLGAAAAEAPAAPQLNTDPDISEEAKAIQLDESKLTEAERKMVDDFAQKIEIGRAHV